MITLRIDSGGLRSDTRLMGKPESGEEEEVCGITQIDWHYDADKRSVYAVITVGEVPVSVQSNNSEPSDERIKSGIL